VQHHGIPNHAKASNRMRGLSMIDLLVSIAVIAVLVSLISPALAHIRTAANQVVCASNLRQVGLCLSMYKDDHHSMLPQERRPADLPDDTPTDPQIAHTGEHPGAWSSLGWLVDEHYISTPKVFYCPSHEGTETEELYADAWRTLDRPIRTNYAYRGELARPLHAPTPGSLTDEDDIFARHDGRNSTTATGASVLVSDAFTSQADLNHATGFNTLTTGLSVAWLDDESRAIQGLIADYADRGIGTDEAWSILDRRIEPIDNPSSENVSGARMLLDLFY